MDKNALMFAAIVVITLLLFWIESKLSRILGQLESVNETLASIASILDDTEK